MGSRSLIKVALGLTWLMLIGSGCREAPVKSAGLEDVALQPPDIVCTSWHLGSIAEILAGNELSIQLIAPAEGFSWKNRSDFFPLDQDIEMAATARLILDNGPGVRYASWVDLASLPDDRFCNAATRFNIDDMKPVREYQIVHAHGPEGEHSHDYMVPYCWHDPSLLRKQVDTISKAVVDCRPDLSGVIQTKAMEMDQKLAELAGRFQDIGKILSDRYVIVLGTPDLEYLASAMKIDPVKKIWMESADDSSVWKARKAELDELGSAGKLVLLLWPGTMPQAAEAVDWGTSAFVGIDMMEGEDGTSDNLLDRLENLAEKLARLQE